MIELRHYQKKVQLEASSAFIAGSKSQIWVMPAGSGKTFTAGDTIRRMVEKGKKVAFLCHKNDLIKQSYNSFLQLDLSCGVISREFPELYNLEADVQIISIPTFNSRKKKLGDLLNFDYIFFDECHHLGSNSWVNTYNFFTQKGAKAIGLTATPCRLDGKPLGNYFDKMILGPGVEELIDEGSLSQYDYYIPTTLDMSGCKKSMGDYAKKDVKEQFGKSKIMGNIPKHWLKLCKGTKTIGFAPNKEQGLAIVEECRAAGIKCGWLDADNDQKSRELIIGMFANGEIDILWNINLFSEGFDLSAQVGRDVPIESVLLCRPTASLSLYIQQVTRALRKKPTKAIVLDFVNNAEKHGFPHWHRDWDLGDKTKSKAEQNIEETGVAISHCDKCYKAFEPYHKVCPFCGKEREKTTREYEIERQRELAKANTEQKEQKEDKKKKFKKALFKCKTQQEAIELYKKTYNKDNDYRARYYLSLAYKGFWSKLV